MKLRPSQAGWVVAVIAATWACAVSEGARYGIGLVLGLALIACWIMLLSGVFDRSEP